MRRLLQHHHRLLARADGGHLRLLHQRSLSTDGRKGQAYRGKLLQKKVGDGIAKTKESFFDLPSPYWNLLFFSLSLVGMGVHGSCVLLYSFSLYFTVSWDSMGKMEWGDWRRNRVMGSKEEGPLRPMYID